ncbi:MAG: hypothetical protein WEE64_12155 [Dehalococcoidia bacterium]
MDEQQQGPFDHILKSEPPPQQRDRAAIVVVAAAIVLGALLLVLVLPPVSILDDGDGGGGISGTIVTTKSDESPPAPAGFEAVSPLYDVSTTGDVSVRSVSLLASTDVAAGERLVLYTHDGDDWREVGTGQASGQRLVTSELSFLPDNVAVFRATGQVRQVYGSLANGTEIDQRALASLTTLNVTGFAPVADGGVMGGSLLLPAGLQARVAPTVGTFTQEQIDALNAIMASPELRSAHVQALVGLARDRSVPGIDLDYRALDTSLRADFSSFVQELAAGLQQEGRSLSLTLPLPVQQGETWDTGGFDWTALGAQADALKLAPDPERPYQQLEEAVAFLVARVGGGKLLLSVSPLSHERASDGRRTLWLSDALALASTPVAQTDTAIAPGATLRASAQNLSPELGGSGLAWDDASKAVMFRYTGAGGEHTVWLANAFSETFKLDLAKRYQLAGVVVEDVSSAAGEADIWPAVQAFAEAGEVSLAVPNGDLLTPRWLASGGTFASDAGPQVDWQAPAEPGDYTLTLVVSDGVVRMGQELRVPVAQAAAVAP